MRWFLFPIAVAVTSLALVVALAAAGVLPVRSALASAAGFVGPWHGGTWHGGPWAHDFGFELPSELEELRDMPPDQRSSHFVGVQISLKDKDNQPLTVIVTPGTVTEASDTSLTLAANDGTTKTFTLDAKTVIRGTPARGEDEAAQPPLANGDKVVVVTLNDSTIANAVIVGGLDGFGPRGNGGRWCPFGLGS